MLNPPTRVDDGHLSTENRQYVDNWITKDISEISQMQKEGIDHDNPAEHVNDKEPMAETTPVKEAAPVPPAPAVPVPVPVLRGSYSVQGGLAVWEGDWGMSEAAFLPGGQTSRFQYKSKKPTNPDDEEQFPYSGLYDGHFFIQITPGNPQKINESNLTLIFVKDPAISGRYKVGGHGANKFGSFDLDGHLNLSKNSLEVTKTYRPIAPKPAKKPPVAKGRASVGKRTVKAKPITATVDTARAGTTAPTVEAVAEKPAAKEAAPRASPKQGAKRSALGKLSQPTPTAAATPLQDLSSPRVRSERKRVVPSHLRDAWEEEEEAPQPAKVPEYMKKVGQILSQIMKHQYAHPFLQPVDPVALNIPDYLDIITEPMDLGTVRERLEEGFYTSPEEVAEHVRLTFRNAKTYNRPKHLVHEWAKMLEEIWDYKYGELMAKMGPLPASLTKTPRTKKPKLPYDPDDRPYSAKTPRVKGGRGVSSHRKRDSLPRSSSFSSAKGKTSPPPIPTPPVSSEAADEIERMKQQIAMMKKQLDEMHAMGSLAPSLLSPFGQKRVSSPAPSNGSRMSYDFDENRPLTFEEKRRLSLDINKLSADKLTRVLQIISERMPISKQDTDQEIEIDIGSLDTQTLRHLQNYVKGCLTAKKKRPRPSVAKPAGRSQLQLAQRVAEAHQAQIAEVQAQLSALEGAQVPDFNGQQAKRAKIEPFPTLGESSSDSSSSGSDSSSSSGSESDDEDSGSASDDDKTSERTPEAPKTVEATAVAAAAAATVASEDKDKPQQLELKNVQAWSSLASSSTTKGDTLSSSTSNPTAPLPTSSSLWTSVRTEEHLKVQRELEVANKEKAMREELRRREEEKLEELRREKEQREAELEQARQREKENAALQEQMKEAMRAKEREKRELEKQKVALEEQNLLVSSLEKQFGSSSSFRPSAVTDFE